MKKYTLLPDEFKSVFPGKVLYQIQALIDIPHYGVKAGALGGFVESEDNLSHDGKAWIGQRGFVVGDSLVRDDAFVSKGLVIDSILKKEVVIMGGEVERCDLSGTDVLIRGKAKLTNCHLFGEDMEIGENSILSNVYCARALILFRMSGNAKVENETSMGIGGKDVRILGNARVTNAGRLTGDNILLEDYAVLEENASISKGNVQISGMAVVTSSVNLMNNVVVSDCVKLFSRKNVSIKDNTFTGDLTLDVGEV